MKSKNLKVDGKDHLFQLEESKYFCQTKKIYLALFKFFQKCSMILMSVSQCCSVPYAEYHIIEITDLSWPTLTISFDKFDLC